jgi:hypothetical protein
MARQYHREIRGDGAMRTWTVPNEQELGSQVQVQARVRAAARARCGYRTGRAGRMSR